MLKERGCHLERSALPLGTMASSSPGQSGTVHASGKAILVGEHFVVHGAPAIAVSIPRGVRVDWTHAIEHRLDIPAWSLELRPDASSDADELARAFAALLNALPFEAVPSRLVATIEIPSGAGLGSSAALGVAVIKALEASSGVALTDAQRFDSVFAWERVFHGNPSGFDHATSLCDALTIYRRFETPPFSALPIQHPIDLVIAHVEPGASTAKMVEGVRQLRERDLNTWSVWMARAQNRADQLVPMLNRGDLVQVGRLLNENHDDLAAIHVSTPALDHAVKIARDAGAFGAKLIGAGGGGCMLALVDSQSGPAVEDALAPHVIQKFRVTIGR